jgi:hypothetical protein
MSALPTSRPLTLEEFDQLPEKDGIQELLDGEVVQMAPPKRRHSHSAVRGSDLFETPQPKPRLGRNRLRDRAPLPATRTWRSPIPIKVQRSGGSPTRR